MNNLVHEMRFFEDQDVPVSSIASNVRHNIAQVRRVLVLPASVVIVCEADITTLFGIHVGDSERGKDMQ